MSDIDTSRAGVLALAARHDREAGAWRSDGVNNGLALIHDQHAATLRALLDERDAAYARGVENAAAEVDCGCQPRDMVLARLESQGPRKASYLCSHGEACCAINAAGIRALLDRKP